MIRIVTADGAAVQRAYANAYDADSRMEGVRVAISIGSDGRPTASVHPGDEAATTRWSEPDVDEMLVRIAELALNGDVDIYDDREVSAWIVVS